MWHRRRRRLLMAECVQNLRRIVNFFGLAGVELEDLETSQTPPVQQFRQAYDIVEQKLRAAELDLPRLEELVEQLRGVRIAEQNRNGPSGSPCCAPSSL